MQTDILSAQAAQALPQSVAVLQRGGLVAFPTDTVYGVGALAFEAAAVQRLYEVKGRSAEKAIAVLVAREADLARVAAVLTPSARALALRFWPGPLTLVVPKHPDLPEAVSALPTVGVRQPHHAVAQALLALAGPLAVTSANLSGQPSATTAQAVLAQLEGRIDLLLDGGPTPGGVASTVIDCTAEPPLILRPGPIGAAEIKAALKG